VIGRGYATYAQNYLLRRYNNRNQNSYPQMKRSTVEPPPPSSSSLSQVLSLSLSTIGGTYKLDEAKVPPNVSSEEGETKGDIGNEDAAAKVKDADRPKANGA